MSVGPQDHRHATILVVEQDAAIGVPLVEQLAADGHQVRLAPTAAQARAIARDFSPALLLLGELDTSAGVPALLAEIRAARRGAARDGAVCDGNLLHAGALTIDTAARAVHLHGHRLALRRLEYDLLLVLARDSRRVFTKRELMRLVWGSTAACATRTLDSHASRLRRKLAAACDAAADEPATTPAANVRDPERWIVCVRGVGYRLR